MKDEVFLVKFPNGKEKNLSKTRIGELIFLERRGDNRPEYITAFNRALEGMVVGLTNTKERKQNPAIVVVRSETEEKELNNLGFELNWSSDLFWFPIAKVEKTSGVVYSIPTHHAMKSLEQIRKCTKSQRNIIRSFYNKKGQTVPFGWTNIQDVETPEDVCDKMVDMLFENETNYENIKVVVLFNVEFVVSLINKGIPKENIIFLSDCITKVKICENIWEVDSYVFRTTEFFENNGVKNMPKSDKLFVIGNPPYQENNDKSGDTNHASPIYQHFVTACLDYLKPNKLVMIIPSRYMVGGRHLDDFRIRMMNDKHIRKIIHFPGEKEIFPGVCITGGVNYFLWDENHIGECEFQHNNTTMFRYLNDYDIIVQDNNAISIVNKCKEPTYMNKEFSGQTPFGILTSFNRWSETGTRCVGKDRKEYFINKNEYTDSYSIESKWKVLTTKADGGAYSSDENGRVKGLNKMFIVSPGVVCTQTYIVMNVFDSKTEAENFVTYSKTKLFRFLLGIKVNTMDINKEKFSFVPDQIDYTRSYTDEYLYKKYNLTQDEIDYIEKKIKDI